MDDNVKRLAEEIDALYEGPMHVDDIAYMLTTFASRIREEARLAAFQELIDAAELIGDPYKIFGLLQDKYRTAKGAGE